jgi:hypothetical protein
VHATNARVECGLAPVVYFRASGASAMRLPFRYLVVPVLTFACSVENGSAALSGRVDGPSLQVQSSTVGADLAGAFNLQIELGDYASEDTEVSLGAFSIRRDDTELVSPLSLAGATFPVSLGVGKKVMLPMTFKASIDPSVATTICAGPLKLLGTLTDSASDNHPTTITSGDFSPACN